MRWQLYLPSDPFTRFDQRAFDTNVGRVVPIRGEYRPGTWVPTLDDSQDRLNARIVAAVVDDDGQGVTITYEAVEAP